MFSFSPPPFGWSAFRHTMICLSLLHHPISLSSIALGFHISLSLWHSSLIIPRFASSTWLCWFKREDGMREDGMRENGYPDFCLPCVWCEGCDVLYLSLGRDFPFSSHHHWCVGVDEEKSEKLPETNTMGWTTEGEKYNLLQMLRHLSRNPIVLSCLIFSPSEPTSTSSFFPSPSHEGDENLFVLSLLVLVCQWLTSWLVICLHWLFF